MPNVTEEQIEAGKNVLALELRRPAMTGEALSLGAIAEAIYLAMSSSPPVSETVDERTGEELPICEGCAKPVRRGQFINVYDVGPVHIDCDNPDATTDPSLVDGEAGPVFVMLGNPMRYFRAADAALAAMPQTEVGK